MKIIYLVIGFIVIGIIVFTVLNGNTQTENFPVPAVNCRMVVDLSFNESSANNLVVNTTTNQSCTFMRKTVGSPIINVINYCTTLPNCTAGTFTANYLLENIAGNCTGSPITNGYFFVKNNSTFWYCEKINAIN